jgi:hypothetical protein
LSSGRPTVDERDGRAGGRPALAQEELGVIEQLAGQPELDTIELDLARDHLAAQQLAAVDRDRRACDLQRRHLATAAAGRIVEDEVADRELRALARRQLDVGVELELGRDVLLEQFADALAQRLGAQVVDPEQHRAEDDPNQ